MNAETYAVTTLEEVLEAKLNRENAIKDYRIKVKNYLITCLCDTKFSNVRVRVKKTGDVGELRVVENRDSPIYPYEVKFFPVKKDGNISLKSKYIPNLYGWHLTKTDKMLQDIFEIVGDTNAS